MDPGKTLQDFRLLHGLTQKDLATFLFVHPITISSWERDVTKIPFEYFEKAMNAMGYDVVIRKKKEPKKVGDIDCRRCRHFITEKCRECFGHELFEDGGYVNEQSERSN